MGASPPGPLSKKERGSQTTELSYWLIVRVDFVAVLFQKASYHQLKAGRGGEGSPSPFSERGPGGEAKYQNSLLLFELCSRWFARRKAVTPSSPDLCGVINNTPL